MEHGGVCSGRVLKDHPQTAAAVTWNRCSTRTVRCVATAQADERLNLNCDQLSYSVHGGCIQSGQSTHKTRPRLVRPLWLVTKNWSSSYLCVVVSTAVASNDHRYINYRRADVHSCTMSSDFWAPQYRKVNKSAISIAISCNDMNPGMDHMFNKQACILAMFSSSILAETHLSRWSNCCESW